MSPILDRTSQSLLAEESMTDLSQRRLAEQEDDKRQPELHMFVAEMSHGRDRDSADCEEETDKDGDEG